MSPIPLGILASAGGAAPAFELISTQVLSTTSSSVTFSSIPQTYRHLQVRLLPKTSGAAQNGTYRFRFNSDSAANYTTHVLSGNGSSVSSQLWAFNDTLMDFPVGAAGNSNANSISPNIIDILDYSSTSKNTTIRLFSASLIVSGTSQIALQSGLWKNTAALNTIAFLTPAGETYLAGSRFSLYGIKG